MLNRRLACLLLGLWFGGGVAMMFVATQNFASVTRLLADPLPQAHKIIEQTGYENARLFLRYQVGEQNRFYFETWEQVQLALGTVLFLLLLLGTREGKAVLALNLGMMATLLFMMFLVTPNIVGLGRILDFSAPTQFPNERAQFRGYHIAWSTLEVVKLVMGCVLAGLLMRVRTKNNDPREILGEVRTVAGRTQRETRMEPPT